MLLFTHSKDLTFSFIASKSSNKIYFNEIVSALLALRQNASWQKVGMMDIVVPLNVTIDYSGLSLSLNPIFSISDSNLFDIELPSMSVDLDIK